MEKIVLGAMTLTTACQCGMIQPAPVGIRPDPIRISAGLLHMNGRNLVTAVQEMLLALLGIMSAVQSVMADLPAVRVLRVSFRQHRLLRFRRLRLPAEQRFKPRYLVL